jgi:hypothetical protein
MQFGVASHGVHIETAAGFLVPEKVFSMVDAMARKYLNGRCGPVIIALFGFSPVWQESCYKSADEG